MRGKYNYKEYLTNRESRERERERYNNHNEGSKKLQQEKVTIWSDKKDSTRRKREQTRKRAA